MYTLSWIDIKGALVSGIIAGILAVAAYILGVGDVFALNVQSLVNAGAIAGLTSIVSAVKSFLTTPAGNFAGFVAVK